MRFLFRNPHAFLPATVVLGLGLLARGIIWLIDRQTEPDIMKRRINEGSDKFFIRESIEGDPMVNQLLRVHRPPDRDEP